MFRRIILQRTLVVCVILLSLCSVAKGSHQQLQLNQLTTDDGLSSSLIVSLLQDNNGFMWIGTSDGLNRYDGNEFKVYQRNLTDPYSLADNLVISLYLDEKNNFFIGTNGGLSMYDQEFDRFLNFNNDTSSCLYNISFQVRDIKGDQNGILFLSTNIGLIFFNRTNNTYELFTNDSNNEKSVSNSLVEQVLFDSKGRLWVATRSGLNLFQFETRTFRQINKRVNNEDFSGFRFNRIVEDKNGMIWVTSYHHGLFRVDSSEEGNETLKQFSFDPDDPKSISKNRLLSMQVDLQNNLWIGAENDGLFLYNPDEQNFWHFLSNEFDPLSLTTYSVESLYLDNAENLWIGTFANGVNIAPKNGSAIVSFEKFKGGDLSIANNMVNSFVEDLDQEKIWVGTDGGGLNVYDKETRLFKNLNTKNSKLPSNYILSMVEDDNHLLWMTTWGEGLIGFDHRRNTFKSYNTSNSSNPDNNIFSIAKGNNNDYWLGSFGNGLIHFIPQTNEFITYNSKNSGIGDNYVNVVRVAQNGNLYLGTKRGIKQFSPKTGKFKEYPLMKEYAGTLSNLHVYDIFVENDTSVWVGTLLGLNQLNPQSGKVDKYTMADGLPSNVIRGILKDEKGKLWLTTTSGLCRLSFIDNSVTLFTKDDGLQSNEFRPKSVLKDSEGSLYFGGINGFNIIYPDKISHNTRIPEVRITGMDLFNEHLKPNAHGSPLSKIVANTKKIKLKYNQSVLTFHFAVMDFTRPGKNQYAYMLENFDNDWIYCGNRREATYTNLDPGKYIFRVKGSNDDGLWNEEGTSLQIVITPPWWATWWFITLIVLYVIATILLVFYFRISALNKQKLILESKVEERTQQLVDINSQKDKLFSIIGHDLKNPFNIILSYSDLLLEGYNSYDKETIHSILCDLKLSGENAYSLLENLLSWSRSQRGTLEYFPVQSTASEVIMKILLEVSSVAKSKEVEIIDKTGGKDIPIYADLNMLSVIFRNILTNAVKFSNAGNKVYIDVIDENSNFITFSITDNGIGIDPEKVKTLFKFGDSGSTEGTNGEKGTGLGLILSKEFVTMHKGKIWVESEPGKGSTFFFTIPGSK